MFIHFIMIKFFIQRKKFSNDQTNLKTKLSLKIPVSHCPLLPLF